MAEIVKLPMLESTRFENQRGDIWWLKPALQGAYLLFFVFYSFWAVVIDVNNYRIEDGAVRIISPLFNPDIGIPNWWPAGLSPGLMFIWAPVGFRATCYYARKVYYRSFFLDPPGCAISEAKANHGHYRGESKLPYLLNNLHRYFFYLAFILAIFQAAEFIRLMFEGGFTKIEYAIATVLLGIDAFYLSLYVLSCHSCKHIVGGGQNRTKGSTFRRMRFKSWKFVKKLNVNHHVFFWLSLTTILITDVYIRFILSRGLITF